MVDYKKVLKNQNLRFKILNMLSWVPDRTMVKIQYFIKTGRKLNLKNPRRFTEKLQKYKLEYRDPMMKQCADKYEVREYVRSKGLGSILNDLYGVYDNANEIDFDRLPNKFVIKTTAGTGGQNVLICVDKKKIDREEIKKKLDIWMKYIPKKSYGREWVYEGERNKIIVEKYIESKGSSLIDYKFFCFEGKVKYIYVIMDRDLGNSARLAIYDKQFNKLNCYRRDEERLIRRIEKPKNFNEMIKISEKLAADFPHVRVDLYNNNGKVLFGELTFFDGSGYMSFEPDSFDYDMGKEFLI